MRVFILVITILASAYSTTLLSSDEVEDLFRKYVRKELSEAELEKFQDVLDIFYRPEYATLVTRGEMSSDRMSLDCLVCWAGFTTVSEGVKSGNSDAELVDIVTELCVNIGIGNEHFCYGIAHLNVPIITHIFRTTPEATANSFCGHLLQTAADPNFCRVNDPRFDWSVYLPPPSAPVNPPAVDTRPLKIALLTDAHIDPLYEAYGVADCSEPTCCRRGQTQAQPRQETSESEKLLLENSVVQMNGKMMLNVSMVSDLRQMRRTAQPRVASKSSEPAGYWGDYRRCDTPIWAFDDVIDRIAEAHKDVDMVYYVGDTIDHFLWETTYYLITEMNGHLINKIRTSFGDHVWVIPTIGNHESQPTNQFAPSRVTGEYLNTTWLYESLARKWDYYLVTHEAKRTMRERGQFAMVVRPGLKVISLNTNVAYKYNWWLTYDPLDAKYHLDWLVSELYKAEQAGQKVHIIAHMPPGIQDLTLAWTREYNRIVNRFTATITAEFNGHTHGDTFKVFYNPEGKPINVAWAGGSATAYSFYNLNYKIVDINTATYEPRSIENYIYNLTEANFTPNERPKWFELYEMRQTFWSRDLSAASMHDLLQRMVTRDKYLMDLYTAFFSRVSDVRWPQCNNISCKLLRVCNSAVTVLWDMRKCQELMDLYYSNLSQDELKNNEDNQL